MSLTYDGCSVHDVAAADVFSRLYLDTKKRYLLLGKNNGFSFFFLEI